MPWQASPSNAPLFYASRGKSEWTPHAHSHLLRCLLLIILGSNTITSDRSSDRSRWRRCSADKIQESNQVRSSGTACTFRTFSCDVDLFASRVILMYLMLEKEGVGTNIGRYAANGKKLGIRSYSSVSQVGAYVTKYTACV